MAGKTDPSLGLVELYGGSFDLMTVVAAAARHRVVNRFLEECSLTRAVMRVAVDAVGPDRVVLMGRTEAAVVRRMAGGAQGIRSHAQQLRMIGHVRIVAGRAPLGDGGMNIVFYERRAFMADEAGIVPFGTEEFTIRRIVRIMAGAALPLVHGLVHRFFLGGIPEGRMARQTEKRLLLPRQ
jgi:hypothetical protein